jgi:hypothetical protein
MFNMHRSNGGSRGFSPATYWRGLLSLELRQVRSGFRDARRGLIAPRRRRVASLVRYFGDRQAAYLTFGGLPILIGANTRSPSAALRRRPAFFIASHRSGPGGIARARSRAANASDSSSDRECRASRIIEPSFADACRMSIQVLAASGKTACISRCHLCRRAALIRPKSEHLGGTIAGGTFNIHSASRDGSRSKACSRGLGAVLLALDLQALVFKQR